MIKSDKPARSRPSQQTCASSVVSAIHSEAFYFQAPCARPPPPKKNRKGHTLLPLPLGAKNPSYATGGDCLEFQGDVADIIKWISAGSVAKPAGASRP